MPRRRAALWLRVGATCAALLAFSTPPEAQTPARRATPALSAADEQARAAQRMDERLLQQERAAQRAMTGICDGCAGPSRRGRRAAPAVRIGEDGLPYDPDLN